MNSRNTKHDPELISQLHRQYAGCVYKLCIRMLYEHGDAEDAVQETFLRALRFGHTFSYGDNRLPWLYRIATNVCLDAIAKRKSRGLVLVEDTEGVPQEGRKADMTGKFDRKKLVGSVLDSQDDRGRQILILHFIAEMTLEEVAAALGMSRRGVVKRLTKFRKNAPELLEELGFHD